MHASSIASRVYDKVLFHGKTLQDLPVSPRFSFTATSLQSGMSVAILAGLRRRLAGRHVANARSLNCTGRRRLSGFPPVSVARLY